MDLNLKGKKALVFGSSSGIGKAVAQSLINEGAQVALCSRSLDKLEATAKEIGATTYFACDLTKKGEAKKAVEQTIDKLGSVDILVTNTGGPAKGSFMDVSLEQWNNDYQSLWLSVVESLHASLPTMKKNNFGRVLLITSIAAKEPLAGLTTSNGLRAGLTGLVKSVANEYAPFGVTFNLLLPGYTATDRLKALNLSDEKVKAMVPCGRLGKPSELADLATFLSSEKGSYITGQSIAVDGGVLKGH